MRIEAGRLRNALNRIAAEDIGPSFHNESLRNHCSWRIGGPADLLVVPGSPDQIRRLLLLARENAVPLVVIGQGSNLLFGDEGVRGIVMKIGARMSGIRINGTCITVDAGMWVPELARMAGKAGIKGLEHTVGIPGTVGGLVLMNGGSLRQSIGMSVRKVFTMTSEGEHVTFAKEECGFAYRKSVFLENGNIILRVELEGDYGVQSSIRKKMLGILCDRRRKFPRKEANCGSVFLSDPETHSTHGPPGKLIENAKMKGIRVGDAQVSNKHANFIINVGHATAREVLSLMAKVISAVEKMTGHCMQSEVLFVTDQAKTIRASDYLELMKSRGLLL